MGGCGERGGGPKTGCDMAAGFEVGPGSYCMPRHQHVFRIHVCSLEWHPVTW
jgi:hypothetical protein